jgi:site-specific DNA-adenine methylase
MFNYYGSKSRIVGYYPPPKHNKIIEPFAGSARYSLKYWQNDILIVDKYEVVIKVWKYLQQATKEDILKLPKFEVGMKLDKLGLSDEERLLLGFFAGQGSLVPRNKVSPMAKHSFDTSPNRYRNLANNLHKIKHWEIRLGCYSEIENIEATWFIDPPYQFGGEHYKQSGRQLNYHELAKWCKTRNGQVIVCENMKAEWLPFKPVVKIQGVSNTNTIEAIWSNQKTNYDAQQQTLQF